MRKANDLAGTDKAKDAAQGLAEKIDSMDNKAHEQRWVVPSVSLENKLLETKSMDDGRDGLGF